jgi:hypothetical protein
MAQVIPNWPMMFAPAPLPLAQSRSAAVASFLRLAHHLVPPGMRITLDGVERGTLLNARAKLSYGFVTMQHQQRCPSWYRQRNAHDRL